MPSFARRLDFAMRLAAYPVRILVAISVFAPAWADTPRFRDSFASADGRYALRLAKGADGREEIWNLVDRETAGVRFSIGVPLSHKWVYVTNDGRSLAVLDDFAYGEPRPDRVVLEFYRDGRRVRAYALGELVPDLRYLTFTVSHFFWYAENLIAWPDDRRAIFDPEGTLALTTHDLRRHVFDVATGERTQVGCSPIVPPGAAAYSGAVRLVTPAISGVTPRRLEVTSKCPLCGAPETNKPILFEIPDSFEPPFHFEWLVDPYALPNTVGWMTVFLKDGKLVGVLADPMNRCP